MQPTLRKAFQEILQKQRRKETDRFHLNRRPSQSLLIYPEGLQVGSSDAFGTAPGRGPSSSKSTGKGSAASASHRESHLPLLAPLHSLPAPLRVWIPIQTCCISGNDLSLWNICSFWLFKQCPHFARGKGKETL